MDATQCSMPAAAPRGKGEMIRTQSFTDSGASCASAWDVRQFGQNQEVGLGVALVGAVGRPGPFRTWRTLLQP